MKTLRKAEDEYYIGDARSMPRYELSNLHLESCVLLPHRDLMLDLLPKGGRVAEVGVADGIFSEKILRINQPKKLFLIDLWQNNSRYGGMEKIVKEKFFDSNSTGRIEICQGKSVDVLKQFDDDYFDWIYIDTVHDYHTTREELMIAAKKVKNNGYICGDDYTSRSNSLGIKYGVIEAVHEFCVQNNWKMVMLTAQVNGHNSYALRRIS